MLVIKLFGVYSFVGKCADSTSWLRAFFEPSVVFLAVEIKGVLLPKWIVVTETVDVFGVAGRFGFGDNDAVLRLSFFADAG